ncbi:unnamed protein product [Knipowitschia caucasica]
MADTESDVETDGLDSALDTLSTGHCADGSLLNSKTYCSAFCELVEEYTGQWHVPLPQLKVLRTALCSFTKATTAFPDDCQHVHYVLSSLALSFFELLLFFGKEEYGEQPLKDIFDSFLECHSKLLRHRNLYLHHVKLTLKSGGPWENLVLQGILKEANVVQKDVEDYLSSELPILLELRVRYLQACERIPEAMALCKCCLENREIGKHLFFHQAYLTCLYKSSLHEHLLKKMADIDGRDAVEIICNTESVEKDDLLLSLCKHFLTQQLRNGDMYYIWDLVFIWSRLYLRAHPSRDQFLSECLSLSDSATNVRAIFPFIKLVHTELGGEGIQVCVELCVRALQLCDLHSDATTRSLVCKTIAFLLPRDLEVCRACALLVFCQERSLESYRTVCSLYKHPDDELHPQNSPVRTCVRFRILQKLKEHLCFDPEFWNLLTLRTRCLELISDKTLQAAVLNEIEEERNCEAQAAYNSVDESRVEQLVSPRAEHNVNNSQVENTDAENVLPLTERENVPKRRRGRRRKVEIERERLAKAIAESNKDDDPEVVFDIQPDKSDSYSLRHIHKNRENAAPVKFPLNRNREYLTRCVKNQLLTRRGHKRWLQGMQTLDREEFLKVKRILYKGKQRGRKPFYRVEFSFPDNEIQVVKESLPGSRIVTTSEEEGVQSIKDDSKPALASAEKTSSLAEASLPMEEERVPAMEGDPALDGPVVDFPDSATEVFHSYCLNSRTAEGEEGRDSTKPKVVAKSKEPTKSDHDPKPEKSTHSERSNGDEAYQPVEATESDSELEVNRKKTWQERLLRQQKYSHISHSCKTCNKTYRGLNVLRHGLSHIKKKRKHCILCGQRLRDISVASKHIMAHMDEMCKKKTEDEASHGVDTSENKEEHHNGKVSEEGNERNTVLESKTVQVTPTANGTDTPSVPLDDNSKPNVADETEAPKTKKPCRFKFTELKIEERIARHVRNLFKKRFVFTKCNKDIIPHNYEFSEDQVVIEGDLVIVKNVPMRPESAKEEDAAETEQESPVKEENSAEEAKGKSEAAAEEDESPFVIQDLVYYLCPGEGCDKVFHKLGHTMTKHAMKYHLGDEKVQECVFKWSRQKCNLCIRHFTLLSHFKEHMKLHVAHPQYFCYHQNCGQRFATFQEIRNHETQHSPFKPQCTYTACENVFTSMFALNDHEWRHYIPTPLKSDLETGPHKLKRQSDEAPWKQRVKVEELWLQSTNTPREDTNSRTSNKPESNDAKKRDSEVNTEEAKTNGYYEKIDLLSHSSKPTTGKKKAPPEIDPLNVKNRAVNATIEHVVEPNGPEVPLLEEHKKFKPDDPVFKSIFKAPLIRPPPSMYMNEAELSMRKRKIERTYPGPKYPPWNPRNKELKVEPEPPKSPEPEPEIKIRYRCDKCLTFYCTPEELDKHRSLNNCSALFGFDSDDES